MRQIVLDTETTGLDPAAGHRIIEIGCIELINRRVTNNRYHVYLNPEREVDPGAVEVHGLTTAFLSSKPLFSDIVDEFLSFIADSELVIHNAPFDVGFIDAELERLSDGHKNTEHYCKVFDTLILARDLHPGQRNSLDALCRRYEIDNTHRDLHGALLDAELLADVYLRLTGGQVDLTLGAAAEVENATSNGGPLEPCLAGGEKFAVVHASAEELAEHERFLALLEHESDSGCLWPSR